MVRGGADGCRLGNAAGLETSNWSLASDQCAEHPTDWYREKLPEFHMKEHSATATHQRLTGQRCGAADHCGVTVLTGRAARCWTANSSCCCGTAVGRECEFDLSCSGHSVASWLSNR